MKALLRSPHLAFAALYALAPLASPASERAMVSSEAAPMYSQMSVASPVVVVLHKGDVVTIDFAFADSSGSWCGVTQSGEGGKSGHMLCDSLHLGGARKAESSQQLAPGSPAPPVSAASRLPRPPRGAQLYFVPIGELSTVDLPSLVSYYKQRFELRVETLPAVPLDSSAFQPLRQQHVAQRLVTLMQNGYPELAAERHAVLIGITEADMYTLDESWNFALGLRQGRSAVVSSARMDPGHFADGTPVDSALLHRRLVKMISREIGFLYYRLPFSPDAHSVLRESIMGVDDLDEMGEEF
jgi:predicted Zn-dependent protease